MNAKLAKSTTASVIILDSRTSLRACAVVDLFVIQ